MKSLNLQRPDRRYDRVRVARVGAGSLPSLVVLSARHWALVLVLALTASLGVSLGEVSAHTASGERVLVSNLGLTLDCTGSAAPNDDCTDTLSIKEFPTTAEATAGVHESTIVAQKFTTGSNQTGYRLTHLTVYHTPSADYGAVIIAAFPLNNDFDRKRPSNREENFVPLKTLTRHTADASKPREHIYTIPGGLEVEPNTDYFFMLETDGSLTTFDTVWTEELASGGLADWRIKEGLIVDDPTASASLEPTWNFEYAPMLMEVRGTVTAGQTFASGAEQTLASNAIAGSSSARLKVSRYYYTNRNFRIAQKFTTGQNAHGYEFTGVDVDALDVDTGEQLVVHLHRGQGRSTPGRRLATLENASPAAMMLTGWNKYIAPADTMLEPTTEYFLVVDQAPQSYNDSRAETQLRTTTSFRDQASATGDWEFAEHLLQEELYQFVEETGGITDDPENPGAHISFTEWYIDKRWAEPTRGTLRMRIYGNPEVGARSLRSTEGGPLTASLIESPESHDGESRFRLRIKFSDDVQTTSEGLRERVQVEGATLIDAASVLGRQDLWQLTLEPDGAGDVSVTLSGGGNCGQKDSDALCTSDGRPLTNDIALQVPGPPEQPEHEAPEAPGQLTGTAVFVGGVDLEWDDVEGADYYHVQQYRDGEWTYLPADGVEIAFYGAGAIVSGLDPDAPPINPALDPDASLWFRVRSVNIHGVSEWSPMLLMKSTSQFSLGRQSRPENEPATSAPVIQGVARVGSTLSADVSEIEDGNGLEGVQFRYQWTADDGRGETDIPGATQPFYPWTESVADRTVRVRVTFVDRGGYTESLTSEAVEQVVAAVNSPATGAPVIVGTVQVGETLSVDTTGIFDEDGLEDAAFSYQWLANDSEIAGAAASTYTLVDTDEGAAIKVRVTFTDDAGNDEGITSAATEAVSFAIQQQIVNTPATGAPTIGGTAQVGETLTLDTSGIADTDGLTNVIFTYQWIRTEGSTDVEIQDAVNSTHMVTDEDVGNPIKVRVTFTDDAGNDESLTSEATESVTFWIQQQVANTPATGLPVISGTAQVGETLTADVSAIADPDGLTDAVFEYQWLADGTEITGATGSSHTLQESDEGAVIMVRVTFTDDAGNSESATSAATAAVAAQPIVPPRAPRNLTGAVNPDGSVTLNWQSPPGAPVSGYQILRKRPRQGERQFRVLVEDSASQATEFVDTEVTLGEPHVYRVAAINAAGLSVRSKFVRLTPVRTVDQGPNRPATGAPVILGTIEVGSQLSADVSSISDPDGLTGTVFGYQWLVSDGGADLDILGADGPTYTVLGIDRFLVIKLRVTFTDDAGNTETRTSAPTGVVR